MSPSFTASPTFFNQVATVPVVIVSDKRGIVTTFTPAGISTVLDVAGVVSSLISALSSFTSGVLPPFNNVEISSPAVPMMANNESTGADCPS